MLEGHHYLKQPRRARRSLGMTDLSLNAAQGTALLGASLKHFSKPRELREISRLGPGAMRLHQADALWSIARLLIGAPQRALLSF